MESLLDKLGIVVSNMLTSLLLYQLYCNYLVLPDGKIPLSYFPRLTGI